MNSLVTALALFAEGIGVIATATQVARVHRTGKKRGISILKNTLVASSSVGWFAYGVSQGLPPLYIANFLMTLLILYLLHLVSDSKTRRRILFVCVVVFGAVLSAVLLWAPEAYSGWIALIYMFIALLPQLKKAVNEKKIDGLSLHSETLWLVANIVTIIYAYTEKAWPLMLAGWLGVFYSAVLIKLILTKHPRHKR